MELLSVDNFLRNPIAFSVSLIVLTPPSYKTANNLLAFRLLVLAASLSNLSVFLPFRIDSIICRNIPEPPLHFLFRFLRLLVQLIN